MMLGVPLVALGAIGWYIVLAVVVLVLLVLAIRGNWFARINTFLAEVRGELKKVSWPSREEMWSATGVVIASTAILTGFIVLVDIVLNRVLGLFF
jgi:preprotein translocase subunit SecE